MNARVASANDLAHLDSDAWRKNASYTNLAALATAHQGNEPWQPRAGTSSAVGAACAAQLYQGAMELIHKGLVLDVNSPMDAVACYQRGSDLLSEALELDASPAEADRYQRTLDMAEERIRYITRTNSRLQTDSQARRRLAGEGDSLGMLDESDSAVEGDGSSARHGTTLAAPFSRRATKNFFSAEQPETLPPRLRDAAEALGDVFPRLARRFGFQQESVRCQQEHLMLLLANTASHEGPRALGALHAKLVSNYLEWARALRVEPACARPTDVPNSKLTDMVLLMLIWGEASNLRHMVRAPRRVAAAAAPRRAAPRRVSRRARAVRVGNDGGRQ
jgi:hypothetical protein